jgi:hypothetical protein
MIDIKMGDEPWIPAVEYVRQAVKMREEDATVMDGASVHFLKTGHVLLRRFDTSLDTYNTVIEGGRMRWEKKKSLPVRFWRMCLYLWIWADRKIEPYRL